MALTMGLYFFHLHRGEDFIFDPDGTPLAGAEEARQEAFLEARALLVFLLQANLPISLNDGVAVADEHGLVLHTVTFEQALACDTMTTGILPPLPS